MTAPSSAIGSPCSRRARTSIASASVGGPISAARTKRSSCDSGSGYVPWNSAGFCVATTKNGRSSVRVVPSTVTCPSPIASSSADCVRGVARLTSSASTMFAKIGPATNSKVRSFWLNTLEPVMSEGSRSGVHWMRRNVPPTEVANARASIVLPVPGRSWRRTWPPATMPAIASRTTRSLPTITRWMFFSIRSSSSAARRGWSARSWVAATGPSLEMPSGPAVCLRILCRWGPFPALRHAPFARVDRSSALHVTQFLGHLAVTDLEQVDAADVPVAPVESPPHRSAVARHNQLFRLEARSGGAGEERLPEPAHRGLAHMPFAVGWRQRVLEQAVLGHQRHHGVDIVAPERLVESLDRLSCVQLWPTMREMTSPRLGPPLPNGTEWTRCAYTISATSPTCLTSTSSSLS